MIVMTPPLHGVRVLDLTRLLPGAICTLMLADLGADVIKIENPESGDYARWTPPLIDGYGAYFHATNRNKRSVTLDLKREDGRAALHKLAASADVLIESFRPGVMARLGCDYPTLSAVNPRLIYCALSGWGQTGDYAARSGHDLNYAALSGLIGEMNVPQPLGGQVADVGGAYTAAAGIMAALFRRERTGDGTLLDIALHESALAFASYAWVEAVTHADSALPRGVLSGRFACYNVYKTRDRQPVALAALEPRFWANFCAAVERLDLVTDYMLPDRQRYLVDEVTEIFALRTADEWDAALEDADCCYSRVYTLHDVSGDPHVRSRGSLDVGANGVPYLRTPIRMHGVEPMRGTAPGFGEHTHEVLRAAGLTDDEIARLTE
jgi:crotonobetainyl-CoA:carnitine CoA-transferase CaiB-like acyl-CoA transferase